METSATISKLIIRHIRYGLKPREEARLAAWRRLSDKNEQVFRDATSEEYLRSELRFIYENSEPMFERLEKSPYFPAKNKYAFLYRFIQVAAIVVVSIGTSLFVLRNVNIGPTAKTQESASTQADADHVSGSLDDFKQGYHDGAEAARLENIHELPLL
ncbi:MAG TPA: hypothetical protein VG890_08600, partial [Puia sp.]|nr:hypothetical protein [Puia sp.]